MVAMISLEATKSQFAHMVTHSKLSLLRAVRLAFAFLGNRVSPSAVDPLPLGMVKSCVINGRLTTPGFVTGLGTSVGRSRFVTSSLQVKSLKSNTAVPVSQGSASAAVSITPQFNRFAVPVDSSYQHPLSNAHEPPLVARSRAGSHHP